MKGAQHGQHVRPATPVEADRPTQTRRRARQVRRRDPRPVSLEALPLVLTQADMGRLLGMSVRSIQEQRQRRLFPFPEIPDLPRPAWSRAVVAAVLDGHAVPRSARQLRKVG